MNSLQKEVDYQLEVLSSKIRYYNGFDRRELIGLIRELCNTFGQLHSVASLNQKAARDFILATSSASIVKEK